MPEPVSDPLFDIAMRWRVRLGDYPDDAGLQQAFADWKAADSRHAAAFVEADRFWHLLGSVPGEQRSRRTISWRVAGLSAAVALAVVMLGSGPAQHTWQNWRSDLVTAVGETRTVGLPDGSKITLNSDTALAFDAGPGGRAMRLVRGEAFFAVAHDAAHPFRVHARDAEVTVLGTRFDIDVEKAASRVTVESGLVQVDSVAGRVLVAANEQGVADAAHVGKRVVSSADATAWRTGRAEFFDTPIIDVAAELSRYRHAGIYVLGGELRRQRISASFRTDDDQKMIDALAAGTGARVARLPGGAILLY